MPACMDEPRAEMNDQPRSSSSSHRFLGSDIRMARYNQIDQSHAIGCRIALENTALVQLHSPHHPGSRKAFSTRKKEAPRDQRHLLSSVQCHQQIHLEPTGTPNGLSQWTSYGSPRYFPRSKLSHIPTLAPIQLINGSFMNRSNPSS